MTYTLPANTVVKVNGIPVTLARETEIQTHEANWEEICKGNKRLKSMAEFISPEAIKAREAR